MRTIRIPTVTKPRPKKESEITIRVLTKHDIVAAEAYWKELEGQKAYTPLVCRWDWVSTWLGIYGDLVTYWFCVGFRDNTVVGITLITKEAARWIPVPVNAYHLGTQGEPLKDWVHMVNNDVLALDGEYDRFIRALTTVMAEKFSWEEFLIEDAHPEFAKKLSASLTASQLKVKEVLQVCNYVDLQSLRERNMTAMEHFSSDTRYQIKRNLKEFGELDIEYAEKIPQALSIFEELITLHQSTMQKKGKRGSFSSERFTAFHRNIIANMFHSGSIILFRVKSSRLGTIGCFYLFVDNGTAFGYLGGLNDFSNIGIKTINSKRLKPGFVMHALCMQACLDRGITEYNFSVGNELYKNELAKDVKTLVTLKVLKSLKSKMRESMFETYIKADEQKQFRLLLKPIYSAYRVLNH